MDQYGKILEDQCRRAARPGTEVYVTGVPRMLRGTDQYKILMYYNNLQNFANMRRAQDEGFDAYVIACSYDVGLSEGREMLDIPVVGLAQANLALATMLGELYAVVTCQQCIAERYRQMINGYGYSAKFLHGPYIAPFSEWDLALSLGGDTSKLATAFKAVAQKAVADGASVIIPVPTLISQLFHLGGGLHTIDGATVLDPMVVALKTAEYLVDLKSIGIEVSRKLQVGGSPGFEKLAECFRVYGDIVNFDLMQHGANS